MRKSDVTLTAIAFAALAVVDAVAFEGSAWTGRRGRLSTRAQERRARRARRNERKQDLMDAGILIGSADVQVSGSGFSYNSPAAVNERNTGSQSRVDIPNAQDPALDPAAQQIVANLDTFLESQLQTAGPAKPEPMEIQGITVTKVKVRGRFKGAKNFTQIVGSEVVQWEGVLVGGADDGVEVKGTINLSFQGDREQ